MKHSIVVMISGNGSNLQALIDATFTGALQDCTISLVISNKKAAFGLQRACDAHIETWYHNLVAYGKRYPSHDPQVRYSAPAREAYDADLAAKIIDAKPSLVVCAGW